MIKISNSVSIMDNKLPHVHIQKNSESTPRI